MTNTETATTTGQQAQHIGEVPGPRPFATLLLFNSLLSTFVILLEVTHGLFPHLSSDVLLISFFSLLHWQGSLTDINALAYLIEQIRVWI